MDRSETEAFIKRVFDARVEGDMDALANVFADDAKFQIAGSPEFSMLAAVAEGHDAVMGLFQTIVDSFELADVAILDLLVDGNKAAIRWRATACHVTTGESYTTELADFVELEGGKIISFIEFLDTALAG